MTYYSSGPSGCPLDIDENTCLAQLRLERLPCAEAIKNPARSRQGYGHAPALGRHPASVPRPSELDYVELIEASPRQQPILRLSVDSPPPGLPKTATFIEAATRSTIAGICHAVAEDQRCIPEYEPSAFQGSSS